MVRSYLFLPVGRFSDSDLNGICVGYCILSVVSVVPADASDNGNAMDVAMLTSVLSADIFKFLRTRQAIEEVRAMSGMVNIA